MALAIMSLLCAAFLRKTETLVRKKIWIVPLECNKLRVHCVLYARQQMADGVVNVIQGALLSITMDWTYHGVVACGNGRQWVVQNNSSTTPKRFMYVVCRMRIAVIGLVGNTANDVAICTYTTFGWRVSVHVRMMLVIANFPSIYE